MVGAGRPRRPLGAGLGRPLGTLGLPPGWPAGPLGAQLLGAFGAALHGAVADAGAGGAAFVVHVGHDPKAEGLDLLRAAQPDRRRAGVAAGCGTAPGLSWTNTGSSSGAVWRRPPRRASCTVLLRWLTVAGLGVGVPSWWRWNALRSDGQVVPSWAAAALMLPSCSARRKPARPRPGRPGTGWGDGRPCPRARACPSASMRP